MNDKITIRKCNLNDIPKLALMNKQLINDEKSNNTMTINELEERMLGFLNSEYDAYFFMLQKTVHWLRKHAHHCIYDNF